VDHKGKIKEKAQKKLVLHIPEVASFRMLGRLRPSTGGRSLRGRGFSVQGRSGIWGVVGRLRRGENLVLGVTILG